MQNVGFGDVIFVILVLGVIHGIMYLVTLARRRKTKVVDDSGNSKK
jgi:hypothetical protein